MIDYTEKILGIFGQICAVPRCSKHEEKISRWLRDWADSHGIEARADELGNVVMRVPASPGYEDAPTIVLQGHMDMVCEKTPDSPHDFAKDPIRPARDGDWLRADRTTLGADNGIAIAMALALVEDKSLDHPPLELLFTVDEEQGLTGAARLAPDFIKGRILINIDSEDEGVFTVGCAGGREVRIRLSLKQRELPGGWTVLRFNLSGLRGGHSGIDIRKQRASANKLAARLFSRIADSVPLRLVSIRGGSAHNAIPRDCEALAAVESGALDKVREVVAVFLDTVRSEYSKIEEGIGITAGQSDSAPGRALDEADSRRVLDLLLALPHGVARMSDEIPGLVETSTNMATVKLEDGTLEVLASQRSSVNSRLEELCGSIRSAARLAGAEAKQGNGYPAWQPDFDSPLLARCKRLYSEMYGKDPVIEVIHAGLETAVLGGRFPGIDMISIGPTLENPHSPDERINIPAIGKVWDFLLEVLRSYKAG